MTKKEISNKIIIKDLKKSYKEKEVLSVESLEINKGEILAIIGKNGSGKSTLIKIISGLLYQDSGKVRVFSLDNKDKNLRNISKFVQESGKGYYDYLSSKENIEYFLGLNRIKISEIEDSLNSFIDKFEFEEHMDKKVSELSQGNRQKLSIIISLLTSPKILLLDEPTNGLDLLTSDFLLRNLKRISDEENKTIILTTHDLSFIKNLDVRCLILKDGLIIADDTINNLISKDEDKKYRIVISKKSLNKLEELKLDKIRYSYSDDRVILEIYDEVTKEIILENLDILEFYQENLDIEDIYYKVIKDE